MKKLQVLLFSCFFSFCVLGTVQAPLAAADEAANTEVAVENDEYGVAPTCILENAD